MLLIFCNNKATTADFQKTGMFMCLTPEKSNPNYEEAKCPARPVFASLLKTCLN